VTVSQPEEDKKGGRFPRRQYTLRDERGNYFPASASAGEVSVGQVRVGNQVGDAVAGTARVATRARARAVRIKVMFISFL